MLSDGHKRTTCTRAMQWLSSPDVLLGSCPPCPPSCATGLQDGCDKSRHCSSRGCGSGHFDHQWGAALRCVAVPKASSWSSTEQGTSLHSCHYAWATCTIAEVGVSSHAARNWVDIGALVYLPLHTDYPDCGLTILSKGTLAQPRNQQGTVPLVMTPPASSRRVRP